MSNDITVHLRGFCGTTPAVRFSADTNRPWAQFRVASTPSQRDAHGNWREGETVWVTVKTFGALAQNVAHSLRKSDPVVISGRLRSESWQGEDGAQRTTLTVLADTVGHDLTLGKASFARTLHESANVGSESSQEESADEDGQDKVGEDEGGDNDGSTEVRVAGESDELDAQFEREPVAVG